MQNEITCKVSAHKYITGRKHCAWKLYELLTTQYSDNEKIEELYNELKTCDKTENPICYDTMIMELEKLLGVIVSFS